MTTAPPPDTAGHRTARVRPVVRRALVVTLGVGLVAVVLGALAGGTPAALGAAIGLALVCGYFGGGAAVLKVVSGVTPALSVLVALLTYGLQVLLAGLVFVVLVRTGALSHDVDGRWLGGTVIAGALVWSAVQIVATTRARIPAYDLPESSTEVSVR